MMVPYQNTYWVKPGSFLAGAYPGAIKEMLQEHVQSLIFAGIDVIVNLLDSKETYSDGSPYKPYDEYFLRLSNNRGINAEYYNFPIPDFGLPESLQMKQILKVVDTSIESGRRVFVHCWGGKGRTGTVVGCWLVKHGVAAPLDKLNKLRSACANANQPSPETEAQRCFVLSWGTDA